MKLQIIGEALATLEKPDGETIELSGKELACLDGVACDANFAEYFHESFTVGTTVHEGEQDLIDAGIESGYMWFEYDPEKKVLLVITEYEVAGKLPEETVEHLINYTQGQWSDGIGEGFEQNPVEIDGHDFYISPWNPSQKATFCYKS